MSTKAFPKILETERLALRRYTPADANSIFELVENNRDRLLEGFPGIAKEVSTIEAAKSFTLGKTEEWIAGKGHCYGIWLRPSQRQIGQIQVKNIVWDVPSAELSYFVGSSFQRQGFATEAIRAVLGLAFKRLEFTRIFVRIVPTNHESLMLATKLGFKHEGLHRSAFRCGRGNLHDVHYFSLLRDDYR